MTIAIVTLMLIGYLLICTEHITRINKATVALFCGVLGWVLYVCVGPYYIEKLHDAGFQERRTALLVFGREPCREAVYY